MMIKTNSKNLVNKLATAKRINYLPFILGGLVFTNLIIIGQNLVQNWEISKVIAEPTTRFVELANGQSLKTKPISGKERSPQVIENFTRKIMETLFSASNTVKTSENTIVKDDGVEINGKKITEKSAISLLFIEPDFLPILLTDISQSSSKKIFTGETTRVLKIKYLSQPKKNPDRGEFWELEMLATLYSYDKKKDNLFASKFNKKIIIKTVDYPTEVFQSISLDLNKKILNLEDKTYLKKLFFELSNSGLEIVLISDI